MIINNALRKRLNKLLPKNYRKVVVERLKARGKTVHPNTVANVLNGNENNEVALEILKLYNEIKNPSNELSSKLHGLAEAILNDAA